MNSKSIYQQLEKPWLYRLTQFLLSPGSDQGITRNIRKLMKKLPPAEHILDVGCGPASWLWRLGINPVGLDISPAYSVAYHQTGEPAVTASAADLPFPAGHFDGVWSIGMLHHLPHEAARQAINEMVRVTRHGGYVAVFDAVLPDPVWRNPLAYLIRRMDRGKFVRSLHQSKDLLPEQNHWSIRQTAYSLTGLEITVAALIK